MWPCDMISAEDIAKVERKEIFKALYEAADERYKAFVDEKGIGSKIEPFPGDCATLIEKYPLIEFLKFIDRAMNEAGSCAYVAANAIEYYGYIPATLEKSVGVEGWFLNGKHELIETGGGGVGKRLLEWVMQRYIWITSARIPRYYRVDHLGTGTYDPPSGGVRYRQIKVFPYHLNAPEKWPVGSASIEVQDASHSGYVFCQGNVDALSELLLEGSFLFDMGGDIDGTKNMTLDGWKYPRQRPITP